MNYAIMWKTEIKPIFRQKIFMKRSEQKMLSIKYMFVYMYNIWDQKCSWDDGI